MGFYVRLCSAQVRNLGPGRSGRKVELDVFFFFFIGESFRGWGGGGGKASYTGASLTSDKRIFQPTRALQIDVHKKKSTGRWQRGEREGDGVGGGGRTGGRARKERQNVRRGPKVFVSRRGSSDWFPFYSDCIDGEERVLIFLPFSSVSRSCCGRIGGGGGWRECGGGHSAGEQFLKDGVWASVRPTFPLTEASPRGSMGHSRRVLKLIGCSSRCRGNERETEERSSSSLLTPLLKAEGAQEPGMA